MNEISPCNLSGLVGTVNQFGVVLSIVISNVLGLNDIFGNENLWPILAGLVLVPGAVNILLIKFAESPKYLASKNRHEAAEIALRKLRGNNNSLIMNELASYEVERREKAKQKEFSWSDFYSTDFLRRPLVVTIVLQMSQQLSGINAVMFYSNGIFTAAGIQGSTATLCSILLSKYANLLF